MKSNIGLVGLAVMGENLALNLESKGFSVAVYNRTTSKVDSFVSGRGKDKSFTPCYSVEELCENLESPRKVLVMVKAGAPVDAFIEQVIPFLDEGDIIIDGGNSYYPDTIRRTQYLAEKGLSFVGCGVSGGEIGALTGPSMMPGGDPKAWPLVKEIFQKIAAKVEDGSSCCEWVGDNGAGHYVKMVHNGIEYGDMQMICEAYALMKNLLKMNNEEIADTFEKWNGGELDSYLIEITADIFRKKDESGKYIVDQILDTAGQKGTGKWTSESALNLGAPSSTIAEAVFARCMSAVKEERVAASKILPGPDAGFDGDKESFLEDIRQALFASKICSYAQGFQLFKYAAKEYNWELNFGEIALMWRGGCIIRAVFLNDIKQAFDTNPNLENLLLAPYFTDKIVACQTGWRNVVSAATKYGVAVPAFSSAINYYDGYRTETLPANLLQAQRDYFGAHTYERVDKPRGEVFHTDWSGLGSSASTNYDV